MIRDFRPYEERVFGYVFVMAVNRFRRTPEIEFSEWYSTALEAMVISVQTYKRGTGGASFKRYMILGIQRAFYLLARRRNLFSKERAEFWGVNDFLMSEPPPPPDAAAMFRDALRNLSRDARLVVDLALSSELLEILDLSLGKEATPCDIRVAIRSYLLFQGWDRVRINRAFMEVRGALA